MNVIAHRGYSEKYRENTLEAIEKAVEHGADWVEIDLQLTGDGEIVLSHGYCVGLRRISEMSIKELKDVAPWVPTLEEVLGKDVNLYLEVKDRRMLKILSGLLKNHPEKHFVVSSFDAEFLHEFKLRNPHIRTSLLLATVVPVTTAVEWAKRFLADFVHPCWESRAPYPHTLLPKEWVERAKESGMEVVVWHEEREEELRELIKLPVWGICTNDVEKLVKVRNRIKEPEGVAR